MMIELQTTNQEPVQAELEDKRVVSLDGHPVRSLRYRGLNNRVEVAAGDRSYYLDAFSYMEKIYGLDHVPLWFQMMF